jgi:hypothetical protein
VLPGARHDMCAAREHGIIDALAAADIAALADTAYQAADPRSELRSGGADSIPTRPLRRLSHNQKQVNATHARQQRGHGVEDMVDSAGHQRAMRMIAPVVALEIKGSTYRRVKNDVRDAADLADLLRMGRLPEAWIAPPQVRELRELVRHRAKLVTVRCGFKTGVHAVLAKQGLHLQVKAGRADLAAVFVAEIGDVTRFASRGTCWQMEGSGHPHSELHQWSGYPDDCESCAPTNSKLTECEQRGFPRRRRPSLPRLCASRGVRFASSRWPQTPVARSGQIGRFVHPGGYGQVIDVVERGPKGTARRIWSTHRWELRGWPPAARDGGAEPGASRSID